MRILLKALFAAAAFVILVYAFDYIYARVRKAPFASVRIDQYYAVTEKFNMTAYERGTAVTERCVYSLFPHFGNSPCWYLMRHTLRYIKVG
jgi:hypothetical protein